MRKTKIICTLGPASNTEEIVGQLIDAGMDVARFNFSHGTHESHKALFELVDRLRVEKNAAVATLLDTKGPEIRLGQFADGKITVATGDIFTLTTEPFLGTSERAHITYAGLPHDIAVGQRLLIDDGLIEMSVVSVTGTEIRCEVQNGGDISDNKSVNVPGVSLTMPYLSERDADDIRFGIATGFDFIAASFVRNARDVLDIRELLRKHGGDYIHIISKIENAEGIANLEEILRVSDGIMVARGDLGVEIDFDLLPGLQKKLIKEAYHDGKIVITATQMLESMIKNPRPTRAEATDVANAVYDGTSAVMLSGETASGLYPVHTVETMVRIVNSTETDILYRRRFDRNNYKTDSTDVTNAISHATVTTAYDLGATAVITVTISGRTARNISKFRPDIPIIGCTTSIKTFYQLALSWGVVPARISMKINLDALFDDSVRASQALGFVKRGDLVVISTGVPLGISGSTNLLKVHVVGD
ncbi:MAG: pyruvate kinase [Oscillospiraceae bacterium]|jgi:pyruvate kinase|nr:pyruvate kinase [Oscillospiraceae bacterium]